MAFDSLTEKLQNVFKNLRSKGRLTEDDVKSRAAQMAYYSSQSLLPVMMQDADVEDNRARFF